MSMIESFILWGRMNGNIEILKMTNTQSIVIVLCVWLIYSAGGVCFHKVNVFFRMLSQPSCKVVDVRINNGDKK